MRAFLLKAPGLLLLAFFACAFILTLRLALAEVVQNASNAETLSSASPAQLRAMLLANPRFSSAWIRLGLLAERDGDWIEAEADLLQAARVDHQYAPAWTLANFYYRRADAAKFWPWANKAAALTFDDYRPLLRLADDIGPAPEQVAGLLGSSPALLRAYLDVLIGDGKLQEAREIAALLAQRNEPADRARLADLTARLAAAKPRP